MYILPNGKETFQSRKYVSIEVMKTHRIYDRSRCLEIDVSLLSAKSLTKRYQSDYRKYTLEWLEFKSPYNNRDNFIHKLTINSRVTTPENVNRLTLSDPRQLNSLA